MRKLRVFPAMSCFGRAEPDTPGVRHLLRSSCFDQVSLGLFVKLKVISLALSTTGVSSTAIHYSPTQWWVSWLKDLFLHNILCQLCTVDSDP